LGCYCTSHGLIVLLSQSKLTAPIDPKITANTTPANIEAKKTVQYSLFCFQRQAFVSAGCRTFKAMACEFSIPFSGTPTNVLSKAQSAIQGQGGSFTGDDTGGAFDVTVIGNTIKGTYSVSGQNLLIRILSKPFFLPCNTIEGYLKNQLSSS